MEKFMRNLLGLLALTLSFSALADVEYLCTNIDFQYLDGSRNGQAYHIKLTLVEDNYDMTATMEIFDNYQNPNTDEGLIRHCVDGWDHTLNYKTYACGEEMDYAFDSTARIGTKYDRFNFPRETFLLDFYDTQFSSHPSNLRLRSDSLRRFYCRKYPQND
jgi:hypothetical protein